MESIGLDDVDGGSPAAEYCARPKPEQKTKDRQCKKPGEGDRGGSTEAWAAEPVDQRLESVRDRPLGDHQQSRRKSYGDRKEYERRFARPKDTPEGGNTSIIDRACDVGDGVEATHCSVSKDLEGKRRDDDCAWDGKPLP